MANPEARRFGAEKTIAHTMPEFDFADTAPMSQNQHGLPSRVPVFAEMGRMFANPQLAAADRQLALDLLVQDHTDLDEVEVHAALWALSQLSQPGCNDAGCAALLACAPAWLNSVDTAQLVLDAYQVVCGQHIVPAAEPTFARLQFLAQGDADLAARLLAFAPA